MKAILAETGEFVRGGRRWIILPSNGESFGASHILAERHGFEFAPLTKEELREIREKENGKTETKRADRT